MAAERNLVQLVPVLKGFDCTDHHPIEEWVPSDDSVWYWLTLEIGTSDSEGADLFSVPVGTSVGLRDARQRGERSAFPPPIIVNPYDWSAVLAEVDRRLSACADISWAGVADSLRRLFYWEFEGRPR